MNKEAMKQMILEALSKKLGDSFHISIEEVLKTNVKLDGLIIMKNGENIFPTVYLEPVYEALANGKSIDDAVSNILHTFENAKPYVEHFDINSLSDLDYAKDRLYVELVNRHLNKELLRDVPHSPFLDDFAVTIRCMVKATEEATASFLVHNKHLGMWQTDSETLLSYAIQNTRKMLGIDLQNINNAIRDLLPDSVTLDEAEGPIWVLTNKRMQAGAATVLFDDVLKDFAREHGSFYVIFSSMQEVLLVPTPDNSDIDTITQMNQAVNKTQAQENILGTKAYYYSKDSGFVL